ERSWRGARHHRDPAALRLERAALQLVARPPRQAEGLGDVDVRRTVRERAALVDREVQVDRRRRVEAPEPVEPRQTRTRQEGGVAGAGLDRPAEERLPDSRGRVAVEEGRLRARWE